MSLMSSILICDQYPWSARTLICICTLLACGWTLHAFIRHIRAGWPRFTASVPAMILLGLSPCFFSSNEEVLSKTSLLFTAAWLGTHKVLALTINRGPLAGKGLTLPQFLALLLLPVFPSAVNTTTGTSGVPVGPQGRLLDEAGSASQLLMNAVIKTGLLGVVVFLLGTLQLPDPLRHLVYSFGMVCFLAFLMDGPASFIISALGLKIIPTFEAPWLSSSLANFWGFRWNITTSSVLRTLIYDPVVEGVLIKSDTPPVIQQRQGHKGANPQQLQHEAALQGCKQAEEDKPTTQAGTPAKQSDGSTRNGTTAVAPKARAEQRDAGPGAGAVASTEAGTGGIVRPPEWRRVVGTIATFVASGLAHEFIINSLIDPANAHWVGPGAGAILTGTPPNPGSDIGRPWMWKWTAFFTLQGPLLLLEVQLKRRWRRAGLGALNIWLARALTITLLLALAGPLFFAPVERDSRLAQRVVVAVTRSFVNLQLQLTSLLPALWHTWPATATLSEGPLVTAFDTVEL